MSCLLCFRPANSCFAHHLLVQMMYSYLIYMFLKIFWRKKDVKKLKNAGKVYQQTVCEEPVGWSKYTTVPYPDIFEKTNPRTGLIVSTSYLRIISIWGQLRFISGPQTFHVHGRPAFVIQHWGLRGRWEAERGRGHVWRMARGYRCLCVRVGCRRLW